jgi:hypothetical protein
MPSVPDHTWDNLLLESPLAGARVPAAPEPLPVHDLVEADLWDQRALRPAGVARAPATRLSSICKTRCKLPFIRR